MSCGAIRSSGRLPGACSSLFSSPLTLPGVVMTFLVCLPRAPALRQVLVAMLAEGALESPSVRVLAFHWSLFLVGGLSDGSAPGDRFLSPGQMCSFTPFRLRLVASALSLPGSGLFFLLWICRFTVGSSGAIPRGNFWGSREGWVFQFSSWLSFVLTLFLSFPGCSHPGLVGAPSPRCDFTSLVASGSSELEAALPIHSVRSLAQSHHWCGADDSLPLVSSLIAARFGLWPYGLAIAALPLVSRPWTGLFWSHLLSLSSGGSVCGYTAPVGWLRDVFPCFAYYPTSSVLKRSSFGFSASRFAPSLRDGVTLPGRVCLSPRSERSLFLHLPGVWLESSRWGHPVGSGLSQISIGMKTFCAPSLVVGV